jgi:hypothetical protein
MSCAGPVTLSCKANGAAFTKCEGSITLYQQNGNLVCELRTQTRVIDNLVVDFPKFGATGFNIRTLKFNSQLSDKQPDNSQLTITFSRSLPGKPPASLEAYVIVEGRTSPK